MDTYLVGLNNGSPIFVREVDPPQIDPIENALVFSHDGGGITKFYWPNVAYYAKYAGGDLFGEDSPLWPGERD
jgi:hypothetical protein